MKLGTTATKPPAKLKITKARIKIERARLEAAAREIGVEPWPKESTTSLRGRIRRARARDY